MGSRLTGPGFDDEQRRACFSSFAHDVLLLECFIKLADAGIEITRAKRVGRPNDPSRAPINKQGVLRLGVTRELEQRGLIKPEGAAYMAR
ncbi:MAG: hypothetical protein QMC73_09235 [Myxococcota bacterium]